MRLTDILVTAVQDSLVSATILADVREGVDDSEPELLALLLLINNDIFNVPHTANPPLKFALHEHGSHSNDLVSRLVDHDECVI